MSTLLQDVRYALRVFSRNPLFTAVALLTIALGIGANAAIFSVVDDVLLRPLKVPEQGRVVQLIEHVPASGMAFRTVSLPNFLDYRDRTDVFEHVATLQAPSPTRFYVTGDDRPTRINAYISSSSLLPLMGVEPILGRTFLPDEDRPGGPPAVILSEGLWQRLFHGDPDVVGRTLTTASPPGEFTIVGVLPAGFEVPPVTHSGTGGFGGKGLALRTECDVLVAMSFLPPVYVTSPNARQFQQFAVLARLMSGVTLERAQANVESVASGITAAAPSYFGDYQVTVTPLLTVLHQAYGPGLFFLWATAGIALLIVCVNIAGFLLVRAVGRERELGVRMALGSGSRRLARQLLTESMVLGLAGGALGIVLAIWGIRLLVALLPGYMYRLNDVSLDLRVLAFAVAATLAVAVLFGLLPAVQVIRPRVVEALKDGARGSGGRRLQLLNGLVVAEIALALVLLTGAGLMVTSFRNLTAVDPGFDREHLLAIETDKLPDNISRYSGARSEALLSRLIAKVEEVPGVVAAAGVLRVPLGIYRMTATFTLADRPAPAEREAQPSLTYAAVTAGYFETMGIPLLSGRGITRADIARLQETMARGPQLFQQYQSATAEDQARMRRELTTPLVINDAMARQYWPQESPLGKGLYFGLVDPESPPPQLYEIVGVVGEVKTKSLSEGPRFQVYMPTTTFLPWLMVRTRADSAAITAAILTEVEAIDPTELAVVSVRPMDDLYRDATADSRAQMVLIVVSAALGTGLAAVGLFGVMAYAVARRTHEIGIRMSLGAEPRSIVRQVLARGMRLTAGGLVIGLVGALVFARAISSLLFEVSPVEPATLVIVAVLLGLAALVACYLPARQASRVNPVEALRIG